MLRFILFCGLVWVLSQSLPEELAFIFVALIGGIWLYRAHHQQTAFKLDVDQLAMLGLLPVALKQAHQKGKLNSARYEHLLSLLATAQDNYYAQVPEDQQRPYLNQSWRLLTVLSEQNLGIAPWIELPTLKSKTEPKPEPVPQAAIEPEPIVTAQPITTSALVVPEIETPAPQQDYVAQSEPVTAPSVETKQSTAPSRWQRLKTLGFKVLLPFLGQNIGWFLGSFCFIAGAAFLVTYTSGFERALVSFATLACYTLLLLWASYQLRRKSEDLATASFVLNIVAVLLMPLALITASRLFVTSESTASLLLSLAIIAVTEYALFWLLTLASGFVARPLQQSLPRWLWLMASLSLAVPFAHLLPAGIGIIALQIALLVVLSRALLQVLQPWIQGNFGTGLNVNHYAAGTLLYTSAVVAIYSCWGQLAVLPHGYLGLLLITLAAGLLWLERQLRQHQPHLPALTWLPFVIYGLPVAAALLAGFGQAGAQLLVVLATLALAMYFYGYMVWLYLSLIPLVLLTLSLACFYGTLIFTLFPLLSVQLYALASIPLFIIISNGLRFLATRPSVRDDANKQALYWHFINGMCILLAGLTVLSLLDVQLAWIAFVSVGGTLFLTWQWLRDMPRIQQWHSYYLLALITALMFSLGGMLSIPFAIQVSGFAFVLAISWQSAGLWLYQRQRTTRLFTPEVLINSGLMLAILATLSLHQQTAFLFACAIFISSALIVWLGWTFAQLGLLALSALGIALAIHVFPMPYHYQPALGSLLIACAIGWWLMRNTDRIKFPKTDQSAEPIFYLWGIPLHPLTAPATRLTLILYLARAVLLLAWVIGSAWLFIAPFHGTSVNGWWWVYAIVGAMLTISISLYLQAAFLILIPLLLFVFVTVLLLVSVADYPILITFAFAFLLVSATFGYGVNLMYGKREDAQVWANKVCRLLARVTFFVQAGFLFGMLATHNYWEYSLKWQLSSMLLICTIQQLINHGQYRRVHGNNFSLFLACLTLVSAGFSAAHLPAMAILEPSVLVITLISLTTLWAGLCFIAPAHLRNTLLMLTGFGYWLSFGAIYYWSWHHSAFALWINTCLYSALFAWMAVRGKQDLDDFWQSLAGIFCLSAVYQSNGLLFPDASLFSLLPWLALQALALTALAHALSQRQYLNKGWAQLLFFGTQALVVCYSALLLSYTPTPLFGLWDIVAICLASAAMVGIWLYRAHHATETQASAAVLWALGWLFVLGIYARWLCFGAAPISIFDTVTLIGFVLLAQALQRQFAQAMPRLNLLLPLLILISLPLQTGSWHGSFALWAVAGLYLTQPRNAAYGAPAYLALLAINIGVYLWAPVWQSQGVGLLQWYCLPAALSVLVMLQLHWVNLRPSVLHRVRLTALSVVYVSAALDVFLQPAFSIFLLALGLSFVGILAGIGLRVRAYLYAGVVFLVLNVLGQLFHFYSEETLNKAIVLMVIGGLITGVMIGLNLYRVALVGYMKRWQIQLQDWD